MDFTLGGKTAAELGLELMDNNTELPGTPGTRDRTVTISGKHGDHDFGATLEPIPFVLDCLTIESATDIREVIRGINAHILDDWGRPKTLTLIFDNEPDKLYYVRYSGKIDIDKSTGPIYHRLTLRFTAFDPHAYGAELAIEEIITTASKTITKDVETGVNAPLTMIFDNTGAKTIPGFSFKTFTTLVDYNYYA